MNEQIVDVNQDYFTYDTDNKDTKNIMIYMNVSKRSFRCDCSCNVFTKIGTFKYKCNSCDAVYTGEK